MLWPPKTSRLVSDTSQSTQTTSTSAKTVSTAAFPVKVMTAVRSPTPLPASPPLRAALLKATTAPSARFSSSPSQGFRRIVRAIKKAVIPPSAPSESVGTDLERCSSSHAPSASIRDRLQRAPSLPATDVDETKAAREKGTVGFDETHDNVDVIVVDADFEQLIARGAPQPGGDGSGGPSGSDVGESHHGSAAGGRMGRSATSASHRDRDDQTEGSAFHAIAVSAPWIMLRWRLWPLIWHFFSSAFADKEKEDAYQREQWFTLKPAALAVSLFFLIIWAIVLGLTPRPIMDYTKYTYGVAAGLLIAPLFPCVALDMPKRSPRLYQLVLFLAAWIFPSISIFDPCGFYTANANCGGKDFIGIIFYPVAMPLLALLMLGQNRIVHLAGLIWYTVVVAVLLVPQKTTWLRNLVNVILCHAAVMWAHYLREQADRRVFALRDQLKQQFKATQKAQVAERQASESKRRFVSYIFHEVRVPLNTALIALQNLEGEKALRAMPPESEELVTALSASLVLMEKVLNDVLDFNRMEAGRLVIQNRAFDLHKVFQSIALAFRGPVAARKLQLVADLDPAIDAYCPIVRGDETRLLQILSNLLSNSCKFTSSGTIRYSTRLLHPSTALREQRRRQIDGYSTPTQRDSLAPPPSAQGTPRPSTESSHPLNEGNVGRSDLVIVRIEVADSGVGIKRRDLQGDSFRLFSPYIQTEIGQRQGGKGSGLGLALVRQIVKLSGGRLGVSSQVGSGSTFWLELPFVRASDTLAVGAAHHASPSTSPDPSTLNGVHGREISKGSIPNEAHQRAALVASQIPLVTDVEGMPVTATLPPLTPLDEPARECSDPYVRLSCLVVDDDALTRKLMARMLTRLGMTVSLAENGLVALSMLRAGYDAQDEFRYQVVFLDNQMPLMSGVEVVREVRRLGSRVFVCGLTGNALRDDQEDYMSAGLSHLLTKPLLERNMRTVLDDARTQMRAMNGRPIVPTAEEPTPPRPGPMPSQAPSIPP